IRGGAGPTPAQVAFSIELLCQGQTPGVEQACCSDASQTALLQQIWKSVELIQRQNAPFAYIFSTPHSGLTGTGEFAVQGLLGVRVNVISSPPGAGSTLGHPDQIWHAGWINWGNVDGFA